MEDNGYEGQAAVARFRDFSLNELFVVTDCNGVDAGGEELGLRRGDTVWAIVTVLKRSKVCLIPIAKYLRSLSSYDRESCRD